MSLLTVERPRQKTLSLQTIIGYSLAERELCSKQCRQQRLILIEFWENKLSGVDVAGTKSVVRDLGALKKELSSDTPDKAHVKSIMARLADETKKVATHVNGPEADGIQKVAECLSKA